MTLLVVILALGLGVAGGALLATRLIARSQGSTEAVLYAAVAEVREQAVAEREQTIHAALQQAAVLQREALSAQFTAGSQELGAKKDLIDSRLDQVRNEVRDELGRLGELVRQLGSVSSQHFGEVTASLAAHAETTASLALSAQSLREALASPKARGQWGERMAEDVLRLAGFVEHVNYEKQTSVQGDRFALPDYTFPLPKGHVLYMDVKFPLSAYLRFLEAGTEAERSAHREAFLRDVRLRVRELSGRDYAHRGDRQSVDYVLLFLPNETITGFLHETDPTLVEDALRQKVVLCSPLTLFAMLGVIRQAFDNFMVEQTSDEILRTIGAFDTQWQKFGEALDGLGRRLESANRAYEELNGPRRRQLQRPLDQLEALRSDRGLDRDDSLLPSADVVALGDLGA
jgi:DNA recombination protein RmuC